MACTTCPFAFTEESEIAQNYGCLPTAGDIVKMKVNTGNNWACHGADTVCRGFIEYVRDERLPLDLTTGELVKWIGVQGEDLNAEGTYPCE